MKKVLLLVLVSVSLSSCSSSMLLLQGEYPRYNYSIETTLSKDDVWDNIVDWFFDQQISISLIDKQSGIIKSGTISLIDVSAEESDGKPIAPEAYCVFAGDSFWEWDHIISSITGSVMARVVQNEEKTIVRVILADLECCSRKDTNRYIEVKSTGVFEKSWLERMTKQSNNGKQ